MGNERCCFHIRSHERDSDRIAFVRPRSVFRVLCGAHAEISPAQLSWLELAHVLDRKLFSSGEAICAACASLARRRGRGLIAMVGSLA